MDDAQSQVNINEIVEQSLKEITNIDVLQTKEDNLKTQPVTTAVAAAAAAEVTPAVVEKEDKAIMEKVASEAEPLKDYEEIEVWF